MCNNNDRVLGRDSDDRGFLYFSDWLSQHFGRHPELRLFSLPQHAVQSLVKREKLGCHVVMSGLATHISDSSNIGRVGILTFIHMLNVLHIVRV